MSTQHLIIQSPSLSGAHIEQAAALAEAQGVVRLSATATRLLDVNPEAAVSMRAWAEAQHLDWALVPAGHKLSDYKVLAMDMDSTLISIECIDEIADAVGIKPQVAAITEATMRGEIPDFASSLRQRVALLEGVNTHALQYVYDERLQLNPGAEQLIESAQAAGVKVMLVSGGFTFFTDRLRERLGLDMSHANVLDVDDGVLTGKVVGDIVDAYAKASLLTEFAKTNQATLAQTIAIGDGANDLQMLGTAGLPVAYHAKPIVREQVPFNINVCGLDGILNWFES